MDSALQDYTNAGAIAIIGGNDSATAIQALYQTILATSIAAEYEDIATGDIGLVGIRMADDYTDAFTDWGCLVNESGLFAAFPMSTKPGSYWLNHPPTVDGIKGVACLIEGQYPKMWAYGSTAWSGLPYMQQVAPCVVYRDGSNAGYIDRNSKTETGNFGINFHSWAGDNNPQVYNLSEGCQVTEASVNSLVMPYLKGKIVTYTLMHKTSFLAV